MVYDQIFSSFKECVTQIEKDFNIDTSQDQNKVLFRGENGIFEKTEPSMKRFLDSYKMDFNIVSPFIDFEEIYTDFYASNYSLKETEALGFLQHYGFPTDLLDLTTSIETTRFFAHYGNVKESQGAIGVFDIDTVSKYYEIVDLSKNPNALRPKEQKAWALRHQPQRIFDFKSNKCDDYFDVRWYKFKKDATDIEKINADSKSIYPTEKELGYFFSSEFHHFFKNHNSSKRHNSEQRKMIEEKLAQIYTDITK